MFVRRTAISPDGLLRDGRINHKGFKCAIFDGEDDRIINPVAVRVKRERAQNGVF